MSDKEITAYPWGNRAFSAPASATSEHEIKHLLLKALQQALLHPCGCDPMEGDCEIIKQARAAIAQARGES